MPAGRPSAFKPEYVEQARKLCLLGAIDKDLADFFGVSEQTVNSWKEKHPEFLESLNKSKAESDAKVVRSLYERAMGYSHPEDKIFGTLDKDGEPLIVPTTKHYPPDTTACIFWLKNRQPEDWRDKQDIEHSGKVSIFASEQDEDI